jgi:hypothetical protein
MIDPGHPRLSIVRQCELAPISRSSFYRAPTMENEATPRLMRLIDEQFLETPWYGSRQMARHLRRFETEVECEHVFKVFRSQKLISEKVARFRQINLEQPNAHHDALEFPDGQTVLLTRLREGQHATVLQLPASPRPTTGASCAAERT